MKRCAICKRQLYCLVYLSKNDVFFLLSFSIASELVHWVEQSAVLTKQKKNKTNNCENTMAQCIQCDGVVASCANDRTKSLNIIKNGYIISLPNQSPFLLHVKSSMILWMGFQSKKRIIPTIKRMWMDFYIIATALVFLIDRSIRQ